MRNNPIFSDDDEFPSLDDLLARPCKVKQANAPSTPIKSTRKLSTASVRVRKLAVANNQDNPLLRRLETKDTGGIIEAVEPLQGNQRKEEWSLRKRSPKKRIQYYVDDESSDEVELPVAADSTFDESSSPPSVANIASTPEKSGHGARQKNEVLGSPKKLPAIPKTPHGPSVDVFWSREFVDDWNDDHSPVKKLSLPSSKKTTTKSAALESPGKKKSGQGPKQGADRQARKAFEVAKHELAASFLGELDMAMTQGKVGQLAKETGGIKLNWTNKLNTTAGRANWRRESVRTSTSSGVSVERRHHASIDLAEKVIDDEKRLLNVIAHEFCHLANFMVSGVTGNPHGKEFKAWAAKCTSHFADRGIHVTTKHTYEIAFKYVWECTECHLEFKRHSKSIHPDRHRCGSCKSLLRQIKPKPRPEGKESVYQAFVREQMKVVKAANPGSPQKDMMRIIAGRWAEKDKSSANAGDIVLGLDKLSLQDSTA